MGMMYELSVLGKSQYLTRIERDLVKPHNESLASFKATPRQNTEQEPWSEAVEFNEENQRHLGLSSCHISPTYKLCDLNYSL